MAAELGCEVGGNFLVDTVLLRKYHFTEFQTSYERAVTILWKYALSEEEFSQHQDQALQLEEHFQNSLYRLTDFFTS